jgi:exopolysaccharide biosynthesis polyprenyl glycosylphosphotransferase
MISSRKISPVYVFLDLLFFFICFHVPYFYKYNQLHDLVLNPKLPYYQQYNFIYILWSLFLIISFRRRNLYSTDRSLPIPQEITQIVMNVFSVSIVMAAVIYFAQYKFFSRQIFSWNLFLLCFTLSGWRVVKRLIVRKLIAGGFHNINVLIVGAGKVGGVVLEEILRNPHWGFHVAGFLDDQKSGEISGFPVLGRIPDCLEIARKHFVDEVIVTIPSERECIAQLMKQAKFMHLGVRIVPENFEEPLRMIDITHIGLIPLLTYKERKHHPTEFALKRFFDLMMALLLLLLFLPLFLIVAVMIKLDSRGPVFYTQERMGLKGKKFRLYKFRSMVKNAEQLKLKLLENNEVKDGVIFKMKDDPRRTSLGAFLRKYSIDELPQLLNVLKGDMSLVGPRPPTPDEVVQYKDFDLQRLSVRPGVTCLSQVKGRSELTFKKWVKWDLWYINNWSFVLDLQILLWTIPVVLKGKGAY